MCTSQALSDVDHPPHSICEVSCRHPRSPSLTTRTKSTSLILDNRVIYSPLIRTSLDQHMRLPLHPSMAMKEAKSLPLGLHLLSLLGRDGGGPDHRGEPAPSSHHGVDRKPVTGHGYRGAEFHFRCSIPQWQLPVSGDVLTALENSCPGSHTAVSCGASFPSWKASSPVYRPHNGPLSAEPVVKLGSCHIQPKFPSALRWFLAVDAEEEGSILDISTVQ